MIHRRSRWLLTGWLAALLAVGACGRKLTPPQNASEQAVVDSLVRLHRTSLTARDPHRAVQAMACYIEYIDDEFGELRGGELVDIAQDRAYTWRDRSAVRRRDNAIANHVFYAECAGHKERVGNRVRADSIYLATHPAER